MNFTKNQSKAINIEISNNLISAGAGSGKTAVLTNRIIQNLKSGRSINDFLILTFTKAAAKEMKDRIKKEISKDNNLKGQLALIENADITTFDAYLLKLIKKYSYSIDISNEIEIGDIVNMDKLLSEVIQSKIEIMYERSVKEENNVITEVLNNFFVFNDNELLQTLKELYKDYSQVFDKKSIITTLEDKFIKESFDKYEGILFDKVSEIKKEVDNLRLSNYSDKEIEQINKKIEVISSIYNLKEYNDLIDFLEENLTISKLRSKKLDNIEEINIKIENIQSMLKDLKEFAINYDRETIINTEFQKKEVKVCLLNLLKDIDDSFMEVKKENKIFNFSDINNLALEVLQDEKIRKEVQKSIVEIFVDEYQDTNDYQNYLISLISNNNLFLVGDVKQSIYGFRNANPTNFTNLQQKYEKKEGNVIHLLDNFRSREEVLTSVNNVFQRLMNSSLGEINYSDNHALNYGNKSYEIKHKNQDYMMEFFEYNEGEMVEKYSQIHNKEIEPYIIAEDILKKIKDKYLVLKDGVLKEVQFNDFVILTRDKNDYEKYIEVFKQYKIPLYAQAQMYLNDKENYEILVLNSIFKLLLTPNDKSLKISILRSFLYKVKDQKVYDYMSNDKSFAELEDLEKKINILKNKEIYNLEYLLQNIYDIFNFFEYVSSIENAVNLNERLVELLKVAKSYSISGKSVEEYIEYLDYSLRSQDLKVEIQTPKESNINVEIMTIHKSKGLEYPIVYVAGMDSSLYKSDKKKISLSEECGFIIPKVDNYIKEDSFLLKLNKLNQQRKNISESIRLLYVAMTRAQEKVIFLLKENDDKIKIKKYKDLLLLVPEYDRYVKKISEINFEDKYNVTNDTKDMKEIINYSFINIEKEELVKGKFSKEQSLITNEKTIDDITSGIYIHRVFEKINFLKIKDSTYVNNLLEDIDNESINYLILGLINSSLFDNMIRYWTEYEFYYKENNKVLKGVIDLIVEEEEYVCIIDYKLNFIDDPRYKEQLLNYKKALKSYFDKDIKCYLYSIIKGEKEEVK